MSLLFSDLPAGFGVVMHDQMPELVGDVEPLPVVVVLGGIQNDNRPRGRVQGVGVDSRNPRLTEDDDYARTLGEAPGRSTN